MGGTTRRVAIVAAAPAGNGAIIARSLAASGAAVVIPYADDQGGAARVVSRIIDAGGCAVALRVDIRRDDEVKRLLSEAKRLFGRTTIVVDEAGVVRFGPFWRAPKLCGEGRG
ncbi:hypothetical protein sos41_16730 [Alphaproteobacteria bacterium SO-S41]|nr:hypothetical protein sos41_16730 [Alphaproteobacteria bacterium SO-S41]